MKAFVLAVGSDQLLFESETNDPDEKRRTIGAFVPDVDGNYYKELLIGFREKDGGYTLGFHSWWAWLEAALEKGETLMDDEYGFDPDEVRIITIDIDLGNRMHQVTPKPKH